MSRTSFMSYYKLCLSHHYCSNSIETPPFISIYFDFLVRWNVSTVKSEGMFIDRLLGIEWRFLSPRIIVLWNVKWGHLSWRIVEIGGRQRPNVALKSASRWFLGHKHIWYAICFFFELLFPFLPSSSGFGGPILFPTFIFRDINLIYSLIIHNWEVPTC